MHSRKYDLRKPFLLREKIWHDTAQFTSVTQKPGILSPQEIVESYKTGAFNEYHFMVCIGFYNGEPIWLSQIGYDRCDPEEKITFGITIGGSNPYSRRIPAMVLTKRRR